jgi:hypothetical protein
MMRKTNRFFGSIIKDSLNLIKRKDMEFCILSMEVNFKGNLKIIRHKDLVHSQQKKENV